jgi:hypothetical protein
MLDSFDTQFSLARQVAILLIMIDWFVLVIISVRLMDLDSRAEDPMWSAQRVLGNSELQTCCSCLWRCLVPGDDSRGFAEITSCLAFPRVNGDPIPGHLRLISRLRLFELNNLSLGTGPWGGP